MDIAQHPARADPDALVESLLRPGAIVAAFQPVVRVADGAIIGYEALARARDQPEVSPAVWLEAAGRRGLRTEVELACLGAALVAGDLPDRALLFLNVSPEVALDPRIAALCARLPRHVLEVTEHAEVQDYGPLLDALQMLRSQGSLVAVDDVGAGYASMSHVLQLSPSFVKIDRSLVQGLHDDPRRRALVEALQAFAGAIGAVTVAEGVETTAELEALKAIGVDLAQGFLLARPAPPWTAVSTEARAVLAPPRERPDSLDPARLVADLDAAGDPAEACDVVGRYVSRHGGLLPSIYLERGGALRCQSRRGQWLVMDGLQPGSGITGSAFADGVEILVQDVSTDPRYRLAVPGVASELAVPLRVDGVPVGVLNVDSLAPILPAHLALVRECAALLDVRLTTLARSRAASSTLHHLSRLAPSLALAGNAVDLCETTLAAVTDLTGFDSGCVWSFDGDLPTAVATVGEGAVVLGGLDRADVVQFRDLVADLSSCYSGGTDLSFTVPPTHVLPRRGVRGVVIVPIRDGWRLTDVLALTSTTTSFVAAETIDAVEALCLQAGSRLASLRRVAELELLVHRDALTGVGNRGLWNVVLADATDPTGALEPCWLAAADVDHFKQVNDTRGHVVGDQVLCALAALFSSRPGWSVYRLGGDEFTLHGPADDDLWSHELAAVAAEAHDLLLPFGASVSIGAVRTVRGELQAAQDLADRALYRRKRQGGDGLTFDRQGDVRSSVLSPSV
ncbi:EAL domain-containing protein [Actinotalea sp. K2]|uniref:EAL domain-containing protein n=1 Tax=Actinotalea sp. K2 TaxID=2939438 RepID=UPI0020180BE7|nr:EAL domain-containing protein [Actinotalea sp. K2]MCL3861019.1 EAL domain-containing protein [Actinotalea sp. K2]